MRGLDDFEMLVLDRCIRRESGEQLDRNKGTPAIWERLDRMAERGLIVDTVDRDGVKIPAITPTGRLAWRIERAFRSGAALKGIV